MKPAWGKLMRQYSNSSTLLVADVDCTAGGKSLCQEVKVQGFPTVKYGEPDNLEDYNGGRSFEDLEKFARSLEQSCSASRSEFCTVEERGRMEEYIAMGADRRTALIEEKEAEIAGLEKDFQSKIDAIEARFKEETEKKDAAIKAVRDSGLSFLKALRALDKTGAKTA
mmetsp:Transcript_22067/g.66307  ORF Transcript_22067/g.66307 Transcript_22067/m.66307 type:complete len:168 (+) Transcript_22067:242-745(+)